jgi:hypothetical protein
VFETTCIYGCAKSPGCRLLLFCEAVRTGADLFYRCDYLNCHLSAQNNRYWLADNPHVEDKIKKSSGTQNQELTDRNLK